jgi:hypothetical protein
VGRCRSCAGIPPSGVVIVGVPDNVYGELNSGLLPGAGESRHRLQHVSFMDDSHSPMQRCEGAFDVIHDLGLGSDGVGPSLGLLV